MFQIKDYNDAEQHFLSALDINPKFVDCIVELADLKFKINKNNEAKEQSLERKRNNN